MVDVIHSFSTECVTTDTEQTVFGRLILISQKDVLMIIYSEEAERLKQS